MKVDASLVAHNEATEAGEPSQRALDHPPMTAEPLAGLGPAPRAARCEA